MCVLPVENPPCPLVSRSPRVNGDIHTSSFTVRRPLGILGEGGNVDVNLEDTFMPLHRGSSTDSLCTQNASRVVLGKEIDSRQKAHIPLLVTNVEMFSLRGIYLHI